MMLSPENMAPPMKDTSLSIENLFSNNFDFYKNNSSSLNSSNHNSFYNYIQSYHNDLGKNSLDQTQKELSSNSDFDNTRMSEEKDNVVKDESIYKENENIKNTNKEENRIRDNIKQSDSNKDNEEIDKEKDNLEKNKKTEDKGNLLLNEKKDQSSQKDINKKLQKHLKTTSSQNKEEVSLVSKQKLLLLQKNQNKDLTKETNLYFVKSSKWSIESEDTIKELNLAKEKGNTLHRLITIDKGEEKDSDLKNDLNKEKTAKLELSSNSKNNVSERIESVFTEMLDISTTKGRDASNLQSNTKINLQFLKDSYDRLVQKAFVQLTKEGKAKCKYIFTTSLFRSYDFKPSNQQSLFKCKLSRRK